MTTKVTVDAHAGWPVKVTQVTLDAEGNETIGTDVIVPPNEVREFYVHSHMLVRVQEMPREG